MSTRLNNGLFTARSDEWETPRALFDRLNDEFQFTLDPCASAKTAKCDRYFTKEDNGLLQSWRNERAFINPPYGNEIGQWVRKAYQESIRGGALCVCLIPARTDTRYWHRYVMASSEIRFIRGRIRFGEAKWSAPFPSAVVVFRPVQLGVVARETPLFPSSSSMRP